MSVWPVAREGDEGGELLAWSRRRLGLGFDPRHRFDSRMVRRVRGFQLSAGIPSTGWLDEETLSAMGWTQTDHNAPRTPVKGS